MSRKRELLDDLRCPSKAHVRNLKTSRCVMVARPLGAAIRATADALARGNSGRVCARGEWNAATGECATDASIAGALKVLRARWALAVAANAAGTVTNDEARSAARLVAGGAVDRAVLEDRLRSCETKLAAAGKRKAKPKKRVRFTLPTASAGTQTNYRSTASWGTQTNARVNNARVGNARVNNARVGNAKVGNARVGNAKVGNARVNNARVGNSRVNNAKAKVNTRPDSDIFDSQTLDDFDRLFFLEQQREQREQRAAPAAAPPPRNSAPAKAAAPAYAPKPAGNAAKNLGDYDRFVLNYLGKLGNKPLTFWYSPNGPNDKRAPRPSRAMRNHLNALAAKHPAGAAMSRYLQFRQNVASGPRVGPGTSAAAVRRYYDDLLFRMMREPTNSKNATPRAVMDRLIQQAKNAKTRRLNASNLNAKMARLNANLAALQREGELLRRGE